MITCVRTNDVVGRLAIGQGSPDIYMNMIEADNNFVFVYGMIVRDKTYIYI